MFLSIKTSLSVLFFLFFIGVGLLIASHKPIWTDEIHSYKTIKKYSYGQIFMSDIQGEGNKAPFFYVQQKLFCDLFRFQDFEIKDTLYQRIFLRIPAIVEMSLLLSIIFFFFASRFNVWFGCYSLIVALSSLMIWCYWAEARPYGLWALLTGCQMLLLIYIVESPFVSRKIWVLLGAIHVALAMTSILSIIQIFSVFVVFLFKYRSWSRFIYLFVIPILLIFYYKPSGAMNEVIFPMTVEHLFHDNIARNQQSILLFYPIALAIYFIQKKSQLGIDQKQVILKSLSFFIPVFVLIFCTIAFLFYLQANAIGQGQYVVRRHVIYLTPVGIIAVVYLTGIIGEAFKGLIWPRRLLIGSIGILMLGHIVGAVSEIKKFFIGLY